MHRSSLFIRKTGGQDLYGIVVSLFFLAAGIGAVWFVQSVVEVEGDAILVAFLVVPLLLYLTLSGRVSEIATGSLSVKLNEVSRQPVSEVATEAGEYVVAEVGTRSDPKQVIVKTDPNRPQVVTLTIGGGPYERVEVLDRLTNLAAMSPVPLLVILDDQKRVLAYMTFRSALDLLEREERGDLFIELVNSGNPDVFDHGGGFSALRTETLSYNATNAEALRTLEETGLDALVIVDRKGRFEGIIERDRVLSRMMLALVSSSSALTR